MLVTCTLCFVFLMYDLLTYRISISVPFCAKLVLFRFWFFHICTWHIYRPCLSPHIKRNGCLVLYPCLLMLFLSYGSIFWLIMKSSNCCVLLHLKLDSFIQDWKFGGLAHCCSSWNIVLRYRDFLMCWNCSGKAEIEIKCWWLKALSTDTDTGHRYGHDTYKCHFYKNLDMDS